MTETGVNIYSKEHHLGEEVSHDRILQVERSIDGGIDIYTKTHDGMRLISLFLSGNTIDGYPAVTVYTAASNAKNPDEIGKNMLVTEAAFLLYPVADDDKKLHGNLEYFPEVGSWFRHDDKDKHLDDVTHMLVSIKDGLTLISEQKHGKKEGRVVDKALGNFYKNSDVVQKSPHFEALKEMGVLSDRSVENYKYINWIMSLRRLCKQH